MATVEEAIDVDVPVHTAYDRWTRFELFPEFMDGVVEVRKLDETIVHWVAEVGGHRHEWDAEIISQVPERLIEWRAIQPLEPSGEVRFEQLEPTRTRVHVHLEYDPQGAAEAAGSTLGIDDHQVRKDLKRFKQVVEARSAAVE